MKRVPATRTSQNKKVEYLGYIIENETVRPSTNKTNVVEHFPEPKTVKEEQRFLRLTSYFNKFMPGYAKVAAPLNRLLRKETEF